MQAAINETRVRVWRAQPPAFFEEAIIDADGTLAETTGQCKQGMDISYEGVWGYHPLMVSLANTQEPLYLINRSGNRPSSEGAAARFDQAATLCREAGFRRITFRGEPDEVAAFEHMGHPYFRSSWGGNVIGLVLDDATDWEELAELVTDSYCIQAPASLALQVARPDA